MSAPSTPERFGPRTLRSYIRELFKKLNKLEERQKSLANAFLSTPDITQQATSDSAPSPEPDPPQPAPATSPNNSDDSTCGAPIRHQYSSRTHHKRSPYQQLTSLLGTDTERQNLLFIRLEYHYIMDKLKDLIEQLPESRRDIQKRYLRHLLIRLDSILVRMQSEQEEFKTIVHDNGGWMSYRQIMIKHRELMTRFAKLFKEQASKY
jgi:hypothetical protein